MAAGMRLAVAGIDLRRTPDDRWVCFEVNPSPAFVYYELATGQPIAHAVAHLLARADEARHGKRRRHVRRA
jgi:glutathione synthase/RimK-type ligase-like ATP-grasp enzyme